ATALGMVPPPSVTKSRLAPVGGLGPTRRVLDVPRLDQLHLETRGLQRGEPWPGRQIVSQDRPSQPNRRSGRDPGPRPYAVIWSKPQKQGRKHTTYILPADYGAPGQCRRPATGAS